MTINPYTDPINTARNVNVYLDIHLFETMPCFSLTEMYFSVYVCVHSGQRTTTHTAEAKDSIYRAVHSKPFFGTIALLIV